MVVQIFELICDEYAFLRDVLRQETLSYTTIRYRVEFENGKPVVLVRSNEFSLTGTGSSVYKALADHLGIKLPESVIDLIGGSREGTGTLTVETRIPIDPKTEDLADSLADPGSALQTDAAETSVKGHVEVGIEGKGLLANFEFAGLSSDDPHQIFTNLLNGDVTRVFAGTNWNISGSIAAFHDQRDTLGFDAEVQGFGLELTGQSVVRDVTVLFPVERVAMEWDPGRGRCFTPNGARERTIDARSDRARD